MKVTVQFDFSHPRFPILCMGKKCLGLNETLDPGDKSKESSSESESRRDEWDSGGNEKKDTRKKERERETQSSVINHCESGKNGTNAGCLIISRGFREESNLTGACVGASQVAD